MKIRFLSTTLLLFVPLAVAAQTADEIVKKTLDARGGVEKIKAVQSQRISGHVSFTQGMEGTFVVELKRPLKMHVEISVEGQKVIRVYDGKSSGWMINPFAESKDVQPLPPEELKNISDESDFDGPLVDYKAKGNQIELVGKEKLDDTAGLEVVVEFGSLLLQCSGFPMSQFARPAVPTFQVELRAQAVEQDEVVQPPSVFLTETVETGTRVWWGGTQEFVSGFEYKRHLPVKDVRIIHRFNAVGERVELDTINQAAIGEPLQADQKRVSRKGRGGRVRRVAKTQRT